MNHSSDPFPVAGFDHLFTRESTNWWFLQRNELILWAMSRFVPSFRNLLEIGCGNGFVLAAIHAKYPHAQCTGTDFYDEGLAFARQRLPNCSFMQLDAQTMHEEHAYDVISAFDVLEHIPDDQLVIHNIARALTPNGFMVVTVPQHQWLWSHVDTYSSHMRRYSEADLCRKVEHAGLSVVYTTSFVSLLLPLMLMSRLRVNPDTYNPTAEFDISPTLNTVLIHIMRIEHWLIRRGIRWPVGGSRLLIAQKPA